MINTLVIKSIRACNLRCHYCYYINSDTKNYGSMISEDCVQTLYLKYAHYLKSKNVGDNPGYLIWHGGEPLLLGKRRFSKFMALQQDYFEDNQIHNCLQTNGVLLDDEWIDIIDKYKIAVGISLEGNKEVHDRNRPKTNGLGSYDDTMKSIDLMRRKGKEIGALAVVDPDYDPNESLNFFREKGLYKWDYLIPMTNHSLQEGEEYVDINGVESFLRGAFKAWTKLDDSRVDIRLFRSLIENAFGIPQSCANAGIVGDDIAKVALIETDGKICLDTEFGEIDRHGHGEEYETGLNVFDDDFTFKIAENYLKNWVGKKGFEKLPYDCQSCTYRSICRGSHPGSRYSDSDKSFNHPSAYCKAMYGLSSDVLDYISENGMANKLVDSELRNWVLSDDKNSKPQENIYEKRTVKV